MSDEFPAKSFQCDVATSDGTARVRPAGELDMATVRVLEQRLTELHSAGVRRIVVDLRALDFMDSTGLTLLTRWSLDADRDGFAFALIEGSPRIQRLFELTGLLDRFTFDGG